MKPKRIQTATSASSNLAETELGAVSDLNEGQNGKRVDSYHRASDSVLFSSGPLGNPLLTERWEPRSKAYLPPDIDAVLEARGFSMDMSREEADRKVRELLDKYYNGEMSKFQTDFEKYYRIVVNITLRNPNPVGDLEINTPNGSEFSFFAPPPGAYAGYGKDYWRNPSEVPAKSVFFREQLYCLVVQSIEEMGVANEIPDHDDFLTYVEDWVRDLNNLPPWGLIDLDLPEETDDPNNSNWYYGLYTGHNDDLSLDGRIKVPMVYAMIALADPKLRPHLATVILHEILHALIHRLVMEGILPAEIQSLPAGMGPDATDTRIDTVEHLVIYAMEPFLQYLLDQVPDRRHPRILGEGSIFIRSEPSNNRPKQGH